MSNGLDSNPNPNIDDASAINGLSSVAAPPFHAGTDTDANVKVVYEVMNSEIGISTLLNRLKQSIASAKV